MWGSFHQGNQMLGETAGIECTNNAFLAICFSAVKNVSVWKPFDLDYILYHGDNLMKSLKAFQPLAVDELPLSVNIERCCIKVRKLMLYSDTFNATDLFLCHKQMASERLGNGAIFTCAGFSSALIWNKNSEFLFDSHSRDRNDCHAPNGPSVLLELRSVDILNSFIIKYLGRLLIVIQCFCNMIFSILKLTYLTEILKTS